MYILCESFYRDWFLYKGYCFFISEDLISPYFLRPDVSLIRFTPHVTDMEVPLESVDDTNLQQTSFDLTTTGVSEFREILQFFDLQDYHKIEKGGRFSYVWTNADRSLLLVTASNPLTGEFKSGEIQEDRKGYASYMAVAGTNGHDVRNLVRCIEFKAQRVKDQGRGFMGVRNEVIEVLDL